MNSSGGNEAGGAWQPPSWTSSTSESSLFGASAADGRGQDDAVQSTSPPSGEPAGSPAPSSQSSAGTSSTDSAVDPSAQTRGVQPNYETDYSPGSYSYTSDPTGYPNSNPGDVSSGADYVDNPGSGTSYPSESDRGRRSLFQINLGSNSSRQGTNTGPSGAIASGVMCVIVALIFGRMSFFSMFVWLFVLIGAVNTVRTLLSKRGNRKANRTCGAIGIALCVAAAGILLVGPHSGSSELWLFKLWSGTH